MLSQPLEIFKKSWKVYTANFFIFASVTGWLVVPALYSALLNFLDSQLGRAFLNYSVPLYLMLSAMSYVVSLWVNIVLIRLISNSLKQQAVERRALFNNAWRDTPSYLWVTALVVAITFVGTFFFIVPGIIFTVWFFLSSTIFVLEGVKGTAALRASKQLVHQKFWPVFWRLAVPFAIYLAILIIIIGLPSYALAAMSPVPLPRNPQLNWLVEFYSRTVVILSLPLAKGFVVLLYNDLKNE